MSSTAGAFDRQVRAGSAAPAPIKLVVVAAHTALVLLLVFAGLLCIRRLSGAFHQPLSSTAIVLVVVLGELVAFGLRRVFQNSALHGSVLSAKYPVLSRLPIRPLGIKGIDLSLSAVDVLTTFSAFAIVVALSIRGTSGWGLGMAWLAI